MVYEPLSTLQEKTGKSGIPLISHFNGDFTVSGGFSTTNEDVTGFIFLLYLLLLLHKRSLGVSLFSCHR